MIKANGGIARMTQSVADATIESRGQLTPRLAELGSDVQHHGSALNRQMGEVLSFRFRSSLKGLVGQPASLRTPIPDFPPPLPPPPPAAPVCVSHSMD